MAKKKQPAKKRNKILTMFVSTMKENFVKKLTKASGKTKRPTITKGAFGSVKNRPGVVEPKKTVKAKSKKTV